MDGSAENNYITEDTRKTTQLRKRQTGGAGGGGSLQAHALQVVAQVGHGPRKHGHALPLVAHVLKDYGKLVGRHTTAATARTPQRQGKINTASRSLTHDGNSGAWDHRENTELVRRAPARSTTFRALSRAGAHARMPRQQRENTYLTPAGAGLEPPSVGVAAAAAAEWGTEFDRAEVATGLLAAPHTVQRQHNQRQ